MSNEQLQLTASERLQRAHYETISASYGEHYGDALSQEYRARFMYEPMLEGVELAGLRVLDAMCGGGEATGFLVARGALVTGLDISPRAIESFRANFPACESVCRSALDSGLDDESFDCVVVVGGLHHAHPHAARAVREFQRVLRRGGRLCFVEPHRGSALDLVRRLWYRLDPLFSENEESIDFEALKREFAPLFSFEREIYAGNVAYLSVLNSMVLRLPPSWKTRAAPALMRLEAAVNRFQGRRTSCCVIARWRKL